GRELPWRLSTDVRDQTTRAILKLPATDHRTTTVVLRAWQPANLNSSWRLPTLRPDDVFWTAGAMHLMVSPGMELLSLVPNDCVQTGTKLANGDNGGAESLSFAEYSPSASLELTIGERKPTVSARVGTTLVVGEADITGRCVAQLNVSGGKVHALSGELPAGW